MHYVKSREEEHREEKYYRIYVTDSLFYSRQDTRLSERYADIMSKISSPPKVEESADEVAMSIIKKHGLKLKKGGTTVGLSKTVSDTDT